jgi:hypothetical protein
MELTAKEDLSLGLKRLGREADHSPPSSAEVKECVELYIHSPNTPSRRGAQLKKRRANFTLLLLLLLLLLLHPPSYPVGTGGSSPGGNAALA